MKPKKPSEAKGGRDRHASQGSPGRQGRRGLPLPNALARLWELIMGPPAKPAKRPERRPAAEEPPSARPEAATPAKEEMPMPEKTVLPPERSEEPTQSEHIAGHEEHKEEPASEPTRRAADILARALSEAEAALVSAAQEHPPTRRSRREAAKAPERAWLEETQSLIRTLTEHFDHALDRMSEERRALADEVQATTRSQREYFDRAVDHMDQDRRFLTDQVASVTRAVERLERRLDEVPRLVAEARASGPAPLAARETTAPSEEGEPAFVPGDEGLTLVISSVPGFQGLMEVQRALTRMPAIEGASVERYFDGEARIVLMLREPVTAGRLVETLRQATGQQPQVEESRPEALRLRVRFQSPAP